MVKGAPGPGGQGPRTGPASRPGGPESGGGPHPARRQVSTMIRNTWGESN